MTADDTTRAAVVRWLLAGDVSIRWQVMRDLLGLPRSEWQPVQQTVGSEGWGKRILAHRDDTGRWTPRIYGKKWISTTYSLVLLRRLGLSRDDPRAIQSCGIMMDEGLRSDGGIDPSVSLERSETCVTGFVLALQSWFRTRDPRREQLVDYLLREQMDDGGWNCERDRGATHSSFHTTINVLEGMRAYVQARGPRAEEVTAAETAAREFFLRHKLYRSHRTGEVVKPAFTRFSFPPRWYHDVLRTLDYFQGCGKSAEYDERLEDPVSVVLRKRRQDGRWPLQNRHPGKTTFELERVGKPSRWNTLRAMRVLDWYERVRS